MMAGIDVTSSDGITKTRVIQDGPGAIGPAIPRIVTLTAYAGQCYYMMQSAHSAISTRPLLSGKQVPD